MTERERWGQARAIVWAQWRTLRNFYPRGNLGRLALYLTAALIWYGSWLIVGASVGALLADSDKTELARRILPYGLAGACLYWQLAPILMASAGISLDLKRLVVYPVPQAQLFALEIALRLVTGLEVLLVLGGASWGLWNNPRVPAAAPLVLAPFALMNVLVSAGVRELLGKLFARRRIRELAVFLVVLAAALPQLFFTMGTPEGARSWLGDPHPLWPWTAAARVAMGEFAVGSLAVLGVWLAAAYLFGRWQFDKGLKAESGALEAGAFSASTSGWREALYRLPSRAFPDPLGAMVEKEVRTLSRAPRFRLVFLMGFSFGLLIWLPLAFGGGFGSGAWLSSSYLTLVSVYALLLLGEVLIWNAFGFDRGAVQVYFLAPVPVWAALVGKNIAALLFVGLEIVAITVVCRLFGLPVTFRMVIECCLVTLVLTLYMLGVGNLSSLQFPRPVDPAQSWRSTSAGRFQALLLLVFPLVAAPVLLAYGARYALESETAFFGVLGFAAALGAILYWVSMESAVKAAEDRKEQLLLALSRDQGPISG